MDLRTEATRINDNVLSPFDTPVAALALRARDHGSKEALAFPQSGGRLTFAVWFDHATAVARALLDLGLRPGSHIALLAENRVEWPVVQLAVAAMGGVLVPLNTHYRRDDLAFAIAQSDSSVLFLSPAFRANRYLDMVRAIRGDLPALEQVIVFDGAGGEKDCLGYEDLSYRGTASTTALPPVRGTDTGSLQYTSGTTGFPKGALLTHRAMMANAWGTAERLGLGPDDRWTSIIPLFHCAGCIMSLLGCLQAGACYVGVPAFDPVTMFRTVETESCTVLSGVPTTYLAMLEHPERNRFDLASLRAGTCGGADANADVLRRCAEDFPMPGLCQVYGQTEASTLLTCPSADDPERWATAGPALPGCALRITDPDSRKPLPAGRIGQIETRGPMTMIGYHGDPAATTQTLDAEGWLLTGDLGTLTPEGRLVVSGGRLRDMIIRGGENIYPVEIENTLITHDAVAEAAVFGLPDDYYGERVAAAVRLSEDAPAEELRAFCAARIARFKAPAVFFRVEAFPLTSSGKIRKTELRAQALAERLERMP